MGTSPFGGIASVLDLEAWEPEPELVAETEMPLEGPVVGGRPQQEKPLSGLPVVFDPFNALFFVEVRLVAVHLFLRVNEPQELGLLPPPNDSNVN